MKNKIEVLSGAIKMCDKLANGETIEINGLNKIIISAGENKPSAIIERRNQLIHERQNLSVRVARMQGLS
jgi:hypothetical protein